MAFEAPPRSAPACCSASPRSHSAPGEVPAQVQLLRNAKLCSAPGPSPQLLVEPGILSPQFFAHPWSLSLKEDILDSLPLIRPSFIFSSSTLVFLHAFYYSLQSRYDDYALDVGLCHLVASFFRAVTSPVVHVAYHGAWTIDVQSRHLPNWGLSEERRKARGSFSWGRWHLRRILKEL